MTIESDDRVVVPTARYLQLIVPISNFAIEVWREADGTTGTPVQQSAHGLLGRAICWLRTLQDLTGIHHYQATLAGVRGLLETTVDLAFLVRNPADNDRLEAWEISARYKAAEALCAIADPNARPRSDLSMQRAFVQTNATRVPSLRQQHWPRKNGKPAQHPERWTGRPSD